MAVLPTADRRRVWAESMRTGESFGALSKPELRAVVNALDDWIEANAASLKAALPARARTQLNARQMVMLLTAVARRKFEVA